MSDPQRPPARAELRAAQRLWPAGAPPRRGARRCRAAHGDSARHRARPATPRRTGKDARPAGDRRGRLRRAVPRRGRQACRRHHHPAADAAPGRTRPIADLLAPPKPADAAGLPGQRADDHRPQRPDPGDLAAHGRGVRRSAADHRSGRRGEEAQAGAAADRRRHGGRSGCPRAPSSSSTWNARSPRARSWRSTRWASPGSISSRARNATIRWATWPRRCWAASMWTSMASPAWRSLSTSGCAPMPTPLRLSLDVRVQAVVREELLKAMDEFQAIGACGIVMDVNTGEVLAMVSLPDYDANDFRTAPADDRFNRAVDRHVRAGQHVQAADRVDGAGWRHRAYLGRVRRRAPDPYRPLHHHRFRGQAPLAVPAGGARLLVQPRRRAYRRWTSAPSASAPG